MKIELTLPALERLIAGDSEIEIGLRKGVVMEFAKKHLQGLVDEEMQESLREFVVERVNEYVKQETDIERIADSLAFPRVTDRLRVTVRQILAKELEASVKDYVDKERHYMMQRIHRVVEETLKNYTKEEVVRQVREKLDQTLQQISKENG